MPHPVIWFGVPGKDVAALTQFYSDLFSWKMEPGPLQASLDKAESLGGKR